MMLRVSRLARLLPRRLMRFAAGLGMAAAVFASVFSRSAPIPDAQTNNEQFCLISACSGCMSVAIVWTRAAAAMSGGPFLP